MKTINLPISCVLRSIDLSISYVQCDQPIY